MGTAGLLPALLLPWAVGLVWLRAGFPQPGRGHLALQLGYGFMLGMLAMTVITLLQGAAGFTLSFPVISAILGVVLFAGARFSSNVPWADSTVADLFAQWQAQSIWKQAVVAFLVAILAIRLISLGLEIWWRPLYPWDAWKIWAVKAQVWFELKRLVPFVDGGAWLSEPGEVYTVEGWYYPDTVPLISTWTALALGRWDGSLVNLPWLACYLSLGIGFYGQLRIWGGSVLTALIFTYLLLSIPLLNTHVALAGYADLWMTTTYTFATMSFLQWVRTKDRCQGLLALIFALTCVAIKVEGWMWVVTLIPPLLVACAPPRVVFGALILSVGGIVSWWFLGGFSATVPGIGIIEFTPNLIQAPFLGRFEMRPHIDFQPFIDNFFVLDNWHLFWFLAIAVFGIAASRVRSDKTLLIGGIMLLSAFGVLFVLFFFTGASAWAADYTAVNRLYMHMVPTVQFYVFLLLQDGVHWLGPPSVATPGWSGDRLKSGTGFL